MKPTVHFLKVDEFKRLPDIMEKAGISSIVKENDFAAIKMHFGEKGNKGYVKPELVKPVIAKLKELGAVPFFTDSNTIYHGKRANAAEHLMLAAEHNFHPKFLGAPVIIADGLRGNSFAEVEIGQKHFKKIKVAEAIYNADVIVSIAHFKGHELCGLGGSIKNIAMGCSPRIGKYEQHSNVIPRLDVSACTACGACIKWCAGGALSLGETISLDKSKCVGCGQCVPACNRKVFSVEWNMDSAAVQEKIAEYAFGILKNKRAFYINFVTFVTPCCDCFKTISEPLVPDIGILISTDPVAIDQASLDLIKKSAGCDILKDATGVDGTVQIKYAESLGLGEREYNLLES